MRTRQIVNCATGEIIEIPVTPEEDAQNPIVNDHNQKAKDSDDDQQPQ